MIHVIDHEETERLAPHTGEGAIHVIDHEETERLAPHTGEGAIHVIDPEETERLALDMAGRGCVSGRLREWPVLARALQRLGEVDLEAPARDEYRRFFPRAEPLWPERVTTGLP